MEFEWDESKNAHNIKKHHLAFEDVVDMVLDARKVVYESANRGNDQVRYVAVGKLRGKYCAVIYTMRGEVVRIISARSARHEERRRYRALFGE